MHAVSARTPDPSGVKSLRIRIGGRDGGCGTRSREASIKPTEAFETEIVQFESSGMSIGIFAVCLFREGVFPAFGWLNVPAL